MGFLANPIVFVEVLLCTKHNDEKFTYITWFIPNYNTELEDTNDIR